MVINVGCIGCGYWGKNIVRVFNQLEAANLRICCDFNEAVRQSLTKAYHNLEIVADYRKVLDNPLIDAVAIATTASEHFKIAKEALQKNKHVYVEKPMVLNSQQGDTLTKLAGDRNRVLMVGHLMLYHPAVRKLKQLVDLGEVGDIYYIYSQRVNLGRIRKDENALWCFAPHDVAVMLYLLEQQPLEVSAIGENYIQPGIEDVVFLNLRFSHKVMAHIQLSWLDPHKLRKITVVGSKKMVVFDDMEAAEKLKIYDKGVGDSPSYTSYGESIALRFGDILIPQVKMLEPLVNECQHFLECIKEHKTPLTDGHNGLRVVKILEAAQASLDKGGTPVKLS